jgi:hypothetical protein
MASPKENTIDFDHTQVPYAQLECQRDPEAQGGLLTLPLINRILTRVPGDIYGDRSGELTPEVEKLDREMVERWKEEAESTLIFVCASLTILCIVPR